MSQDNADAVCILLLLAVCVGMLIGFLVGRIWEIEKREDKKNFERGYRGEEDEDD